LYGGADEGLLSWVGEAALEAHDQLVQFFPRFWGRSCAEIVASYKAWRLEFTFNRPVCAVRSKQVSSESTINTKLFVTAPGTSDRECLEAIGSDLRNGRRVVHADVLSPAPHSSGPDESVARQFEQEHFVCKLAGYAAWNIGANTLGTTMPRANMRTHSSRD